MTERHRPRSPIVDTISPDLNITIPEFGNLTVQEAIDILKISAQAQTLEEIIISLSKDGHAGTTYDDLINNATSLGFSPEEIQQLKGFEAKVHVPFFINSLGTVVDKVAKVYFATKYYNDRGRNGPTDKDLFFSYYRDSTPTAVALGAFSHLNKNIAYYIPREVLRIALGMRGAFNTSMPEHFSLPELGIMPETSAIGALSGEAIATAAGNSMFHSDSALIARDSVVHLSLGEGGVNEGSLRIALGSLETQLYLLARTHFNLSKQNIQELESNHEKRREHYRRLLKERQIGLALHVYDNNLAISCPSEIVHPWGSPIWLMNWLESEGLVKRYQYDGSNFLQILQNTADMFATLREDGKAIVSRIKVPRPADHSISNYTGLKSVRPDKKSDLRSVPDEEFRYHKNTDALLDAAQEFIDREYITPNKLAEEYRNSQ